MARLPWLVLSAALLALGGCNRQSEAPRTANGASTSTSAGTGIVTISGWSGAASTVLAQDLNGDQRPDLVLSSHANNIVQPFLQGPEGRFEPLPPLEDVGFHPNGVTIVKDAAGAELLVQSAETRNELRIYTFDGRHMAYRSAISTSAPLMTVAVDWPHWPRSLLVIPKSGTTLVLHRCVDPVAGSAGESFQLDASQGGRSHSIRKVAIADLDGDGRQAVLYTVPNTGALRALRSDPDGNISSENLWMAGRGELSTLVLAGDLDGDGRSEVFLSGQPKQPLRILSAKEGGDIRLVSEVELAPDFTQDGIAVRDADGALVLLLSRDKSLTALRFAAGLTSPPDQLVIPKGAGIGWVSMASADFDGDGTNDLALARSGPAALPVLVVHGPLWDRLPRLAGYFSQPPGR